MTKFTQLFKQLLVAFPDAKGKVNKETLQLYSRKLADIPDHILEQAIDNYIDQGKWFPKIAELREEARRVANLPTLMSSFASAEKDDPPPPSPVPDPTEDVLLIAFLSLEDDLHHKGEFDERDWLALADKFEKADRPHRADNLRRRVERIKDGIKELEPA
jgi:hypothetical protein